MNSIHKKYCVLLDNNNDILCIFDCIEDTLEFIKNYIYSTSKILIDNDGNINKFNKSILKWRINCFNGINIGHYSFNDEYKLINTDSVNHINFKLNIVNNSDINKIFIGESESINYNLPINISEINIINGHGTETLIANCLETEVQVEDKSELLKRKIHELEEMKQKEIDRIKELKNKQLKDRMENQIKINKDKEDEYRRKFIVDRKLYFTFKKEINSGQRDENDIPKLYINQWNVFNNMELNNNLDTTIDNLEDITNSLETSEDKDIENLIQKEICIYRELYTETIKHNTNSYNYLFNNDVSFENNDTDSDEDDDNDENIINVNTEVDNNYILNNSNI
jgi:hypothetical protein